MVSEVRVTYVIGSLDTGGAELQLVELLRRLDRARFRASLALYEPDRYGRADGLVSEVLSLGIPSDPAAARAPKGYYFLRALSRLLRFCRNWKPTIVHAFLPGACAVGCTAARLAGVPVVIGSRRALVGSYRREGSWKSMVDRAALYFADEMVGNCEAVTQQLVCLDGFPAAHSATIYNGVDVSRFQPDSGHEYRRELGFSDADVVFGILANFFPYKKHIDFVHAAALIREQIPEARFVMAGHDRGTLRQTEVKVHQLGLAPYCAIVPGTSSPERLLSALDVYVCTSETEGFSNVLLEAMACGKPIIATHVGGNAEAVQESENGYLVPCGRPDLIAAHARSLARDPALRIRMGTLARERAVRRFSVEAMVQAHQNLYERLLHRAGKQ